MGDKTGIEWTDATWNPVVGCSIVSPGCKRCYAMRTAGRLEAMSVAHERDHGGDPGPMVAYRGTTEMSRAGFVWTGKVQVNPNTLDQPLRCKKPRRIFVNSMSDLFHENLLDDAIDKVFAVMALCPQHTFQVLTKRPARMRDYLRQLDEEPHQQTVKRFAAALKDLPLPDEINIPFPNVWLGVSVEDQARADKRIPLLLETPAAKRFLSCEPLLGGLRLDRICIVAKKPGSIRAGIHVDALAGRYCESGLAYKGAWDANSAPPPDTEHRKIDWVIVGGESGSGARPFNVTWARAIVDQCKEAGVAAFVKQLGRRPYWDLLNGCGKWPTLTRIDLEGKQVDAITLKDKKGGDWAEWPADLRVREFPTCVDASAGEPAQAGAA